jgi:class 3 adenylate cyclase/tetratricopeptide (TPR) repeat protein
MSKTQSELKAMSLSDLVRLGHESCDPKKPFDPAHLETIQQLAEVLLKRGDPLLAYDVLTRLPEVNQADSRVRQLLGLALARSGATEEASKVLRRLLSEQSKLPPPKSVEELISLEETLCLTGRVYKDKGLPSKPGGDDLNGSELDLSYQLYSIAYKLRRNYYPGINCAFLCILRNERETAADFALEALESCMAEAGVASKAIEDLPYWIYATMGDASLILGQDDKAKMHYQKACDACRAQKHFGSLSATRTQLRYLLAALGRDSEQSKDYLAMPNVGVFVGHMIDTSTQKPERFPARIELDVQREIEEWLKKNDVLVGYCSAACGADILFAEALLKRGGTVQVILPFEADVFRKLSVIDVAGEAWGKRFDELLPDVVIETVSEQPLNFGDKGYEYANLVLHGSAIARAEQLGTSLRHLAVWNRLEGNGPGGTSEVIHQWSHTTEVIDVIPVPRVAKAAPFNTKSEKIPSGSEDDATGATPFLGTQIAALLFADVKGFSGLTESHIPAFVNHVLGAVAELLDSKDWRTSKRNTWGDGLYIAFDKIEHAGCFALELADLVQKTDWRIHGLPRELAIRTAIHAGPVYVGKDPLTERINCMGTHVSHAARLEPQTPQNKVYASAEFAAMAAALGITAFTCQYVGHMAWAKGWGIFPTYQVVRG